MRSGHRHRSSTGCKSKSKEGQLGHVLQVRLCCKLLNSLWKTIRSNHQTISSAHPFCLQTGRCPCRRVLRDVQYSIRLFELIPVTRSDVGMLVYQKEHHKLYYGRERLRSWLRHRLHNVFVSKTTAALTQHTPLWTVCTHQDLLLDFNDVP